MKDLPKVGLYLSTKKILGMRLAVEDVFGREDDEDELSLAITPTSSELNNVMVNTEC